MLSTNLKLLSKIKIIQR